MNNNKGIEVITIKPDFKSAMKRARAFCSKQMFPPISRSEMYSVYRSSKNSGMIFFRCKFN